jgi:predicted peptidase
MREAIAGGLRYLLSLPAGGEPAPLLCFLHGYDEAAPMPLERGVTKHGPLRTGSAAIARDSFVIVAPQLPRAGDLWLRYADAVLEIIASAANATRVDPSRRYLTGFSFGGNGVFELGGAHPDFWAALWAVDPTRVPREPPPLPVWLSMGQVARIRSKGFVQTLGLVDATTLASASLAHTDRVFTDEGHDHVGSATHAYADTRCYEWLLARRSGQ